MSGYRLSGIYIIKNVNGELTLCDLDGDVVEAHVGKGFSLGLNYPVNYWINAPFLQAGWNQSIEPVSKNVWGNISINDIKDVSCHSCDKNLGKYKHCSCVKFKWGLLVFKMSKENTMKLLNKLKTSKIQHLPNYGEPKSPPTNFDLLYFEPIQESRYDSKGKPLGLYNTNRSVLFLNPERSRQFNLNIVKLLKNRLNYYF
jgi:hypothetical protein